MNLRHLVTFTLLAVAGAAAGWFWPETDPAPTQASSFASSASERGEPAATPGSPAPVAAAHAREAVPVPAEEDPPTEARPTGVLVGLVLDASGRGIAGASVTAVPAGGSPAASTGNATTTDEQGAFRLVDVPVGSLRVRAVATGTVAAVSAAVMVVEDTDVRVETLRLTPAATLRGTVVGSGGAAVAGAVVQANGERAQSGADGHFVVEHLAPRPCTVDVRADGMLSWRQVDVDPAQELHVVLPAGLVVAGTVRDARTGAPVEEFAVRARQLRSLGAVKDGPPAWQLRHLLATPPPSGSADEAARAMRDEYAQRLARIEALPAAVGRVPNDLGAPSSHAEGRFTIDRLNEGLFEIEVVSPTHWFARSAPVALRRDEAVPQLQFTLEPACSLRGNVQMVDGGPLAGAVVEIVRASAQGNATAGPSRFAWALGEPIPEGDVLAATVTDAKGAFDAKPLPPGAVYVIARHERACIAASPQVTLPHAGAVELRLTGRPVLTGRVLGVPAERAAEVFVTIAGGASQLHSVRTEADGTYRFEQLEPGQYVIRAGVGNAEALEAAFVHQVFGATAEPSRPQLVLRAGERRSLDLALVLPPAGSVAGTVRINGQPASACRITLVVPDSPRPLTASTDPLGAFVLRDAPVGEFEFRVHTRAGNLQEVHRERVRITANAVSTVAVDAPTGSLVGRVVASDGTPENQLRGDVLLLPGCTEMPADLATYRREQRVHQIAVRDGTFRGEVLTAGRALAVVRIRNRVPATQVVEIPVGATNHADLTCGAAR